jgi:hypothetical protein
MLIYSICYYYSTNKYSNIDNHLKEFNKINDEKIFILNVMIDSHDLTYHNKVQIELSNYIDLSNSYVLPNYNWGGTILGLWMAYKYCYDKYDNSLYLVHFEEDFGPYNDQWYEHAKNLLLSDDYIYIGESNLGRVKTKNDDKRLTYYKYKNSTRLGDPEVWTSGGFYFTTLENLKKMEDKIGIFHKGNQKTNRKDNYRLDGIDLGEVGFPTLLYHSGFKFNALLRKTYFIHNW